VKSEIGEIYLRQNKDQSEQKKFEDKEGPAPRPHWRTPFFRKTPYSSGPELSMEFLHISKSGASGPLTAKRVREFERTAATLAKGMAAQLL